MLHTPPLAAEAAALLAKELLDRSVVVADGTIEWSPRGWKARVTGRGMDRLQRLELFPVLRVGRTFKGEPRAAFRLVDTEYCGGGTNVVRLPPGTSVRLLLEPFGAVDGTPLWLPIATSWSGTRADERRVDAAIDALLDSLRDPSAASLVSEPPMLPE